MNIGDKVYWMGFNNQPVAAIVKGIGADNKVFIKPAGTGCEVDAYWSDKADFTKDINEVKERCWRTYKERLKSNILRLQNA